MDVILYTMSFIAIILSLIATVWIARKPGEEQYDSKAVGNLTRLTWLYTVVTFVSLIVFFVFLYFV